MDKSALACTVLLRCAFLCLPLLFSGCPNGSQPDESPTDIDGSDDRPTAYYIAVDGNDADPGTKSKPWATFSRGMEAIQPGDTVYVRGGTYRQRLLFRKSGLPDAPITFAAYPGETPIIDGTGLEAPNKWLWDALIESVGNDYIRIKGFTIQNSPLFGMMVNEGRDIAIEDNRTVDTGGSGIMAWDDTELIIRHNEVEEANRNGEGSQEAISLDGSAGFEISYNEVHDTYMEGIDAKNGSADGRIFGNTVHGIMRIGIYIDAWQGHNHTIDVFGNTVYDCAEGIAINAENGGTASGIRVWGNLLYEMSSRREDHPNGDGHITGMGAAFRINMGGVPEATHTVRDIEIFGNAVRGNEHGFIIGVPINGTTENFFIHGNLVFDNVTGGISIDDYSGATATLKNIRVVNNTVWNNGWCEGAELTHIDNWEHGGIFVTARNSDDILVMNNIVGENNRYQIALPEDGIDGVPIGEVSILNNLIFGFRGVGVREYRGADYVEGDPLLLKTGPHPFMPSADSPAIDAGCSQGAPSVDFAGTARPQGTGVDIGAYEGQPPL